MEKGIAHGPPPWIDHIIHYNVWCTLWQLWLQLQLVVYYIQLIYDYYF